MLTTIIAFLVMINPFALFLYLEPIRKDLNHKDFLKVIAKATLISFVVCLIFFYFGNFVFQNIFQINVESFRIFGGIVLFSFSYLFIVKGQEALIMMKEDLDNLASEIALPFMVGAGTISLSILLSQEMSYFLGTTTLIIIFLVNFLLLMFLIKLRKMMDTKRIKIAFDKNMGVLLRLNGFFIGAMGIDMILTGINNLFLI
ncbi:MarC family protein [Candidatus Woesearchaeota archaeon]|jgi:multiple antibiotic resistance protein|nr:MarC family protein [Candidatus Woesearchaeota archaeon]MBT4151111.1 MarC family protein [Candidatus Woesearchaeota archaeon]MBT4247929.1 MarC family protein [Candidatus Woesearchaeota archaeon]MBT4433932.1 MarC family protein [Candidatus Woesearchaeota archaeon]MBT7332037.1 MarC family protein [Candidatus Woesearchaeota archaeon]